MNQELVMRLSGMVAGPPNAQAASKELIRSVAHRPIDEVMLEQTARCIAELRGKAEGREDIAAFCRSVSRTG